MRKTRGPGHKMKVLSLVERGGKMRSIMVESVSRPAIEKIVKANVDRESQLMTDEARLLIEKWKAEGLPIRVFN